MRKHQRLLAAVLVLLMICCCEAGLAGTYVLPSSVTQLDSEAFSGNTKLTEITLQSGVTSIGNKCFYGCSNLYKINIPSTVTSIGTSCFTGCLSDFLIRTTPGSYAMRWARDNHVDFQANTHYRAFLIGQTYDDEPENQLNGTMNDVGSMKQFLSNASGTAYTISVGHDLTASGILSGIDSNFGNAQDQDVSLFYYAGHGAGDGSLCGVQSTYVSPSKLRQKLDGIRGRKIIILDSCHSGGIINSESGTMTRSLSAQSNQSAADFASSFISAFTSTSDKADDFNRYYILVAAAEDESSWETTIGNQVAGMFTSYLAKGLGYNPWTQSYTDLFADTNNSGAVSLREAYEYIKTNLTEAPQTVQVFPSDCTWISIIRAR